MAQSHHGIFALIVSWLIKKGCSTMDDFLGSNG